MNAIGFQGGCKDKGSCGLDANNAEVPPSRGTDQDMDPPVILPVGSKGHCKNNDNCGANKVSPTTSAIDQFPIVDRIILGKYFNNKLDSSGYTVRTKNVRSVPPPPHGRPRNYSSGKANVSKTSSTISPSDESLSSGNSSSNVLITPTRVPSALNLQLVTPNVKALPFMKSPSNATNILITPAKAPSAFKPQLVAPNVVNNPSRQLK